MQVTCEYCGKVFSRVPSKVKEHNFCSRECRGKAESKKLILCCKICGKNFLRSKSHAEQSKISFCSRECYKKFLYNNGTRKGCKITEETRTKMKLAASGKNNSMWGKHLSEEHRKKISIGNKGHKGAWTGKKQPKELIEKRVAKLRGKTCSEAKRQKISKANRGKKRTIEQREQMSLSRSETFKDFNSNKFTKYGYFYSNKNQKNLFYRSSYELKAYKILESNNNVLKYEREYIRIPYYYGIQRYYIPDIYVEYKNGDRKIIEVKAKWMVNDKKNKAKFKAAKDFCIQNVMKFEIWTEKELKIELHRNT